MKRFFKYSMIIILALFSFFSIVKHILINDTSERQKVEAWWDEKLAYLNDTYHIQNDFLEAVFEDEWNESIVEQSITGEQVRFPQESVLVAYYQLTEDEQAIYQRLRDGIAVHADKIEFYPQIELSTLEKCILCMYMDYPQYYWYTGNYTYWQMEDTERVSSVEPEYILTEDEVAENESVLCTITDTILQNVPKESSDYETVKYIYESLIAFTEYSPGCKYDQSLASVFLYGESVCAGYAKAFQYLLQKIGIPCIYISGDALSIRNENETWEPHAWNMIELDGQYYYVDVTWGDPFPLENGEKKEIEYGYLCGMPETFEKYHAANVPVELPECTMGDYEYYQLAGMRFASFEYGDIRDTLAELTKNGQITMSFAFDHTEDYNTMIEELLDHELGKKAGQIRADMTDKDYWHYEVKHDDYLQCVEVTWVE